MTYRYEKNFSNFNPIPKTTYQRDMKLQPNSKDNISTTYRYEKIFLK
jgi:hypothetical protein